MDQRATTPADAIAVLSATPPDVLAGFLTAEYPQTVAFALLQLPKTDAAKVLARLPESFMREVVGRMAVAAKPQPVVAERVLAALASRLREGPQPEGEAARRARMEAMADVVAEEDVGVAAAFRKAFAAAFPKDAPRAAPSVSEFDVEAWLANAKETGQAFAEVGQKLGRILGASFTEAADALVRGEFGYGPPEVEPIEGIQNVFTALTQGWRRSLTAETGLSVDVELDQLCSLRLGDYLNSIPLPAMQAVFAAPEWQGQGLAVCDCALIYAMTDLLLGGERVPGLRRIEGRPFAAGEHAVMGLVVEGALRDLKAAFAPWGADFRLERIATDPWEARIVDRAAPCLLAKLRVDVEDRGGRLEILLPYSALATVRGVIEGQSSAWTRAQAALDTVVETVRVEGGDAERLGAEVRAFVAQIQRSGLLSRR